MLRNLEFSVRESGVGGSAVVVPIASSAVGGSVGMRDRRCDRDAGKTYYGQLSSGESYEPGTGRDLRCEDYWTALTPSFWRSARWKVEHKPVELREALYEKIYRSDALLSARYQRIMRGA
jgi:hypothetical protein